MNDMTATLKDLRQREPVRKAEQTARKFLQDLRTGSGTARGCARIRI